VIIGLWGRSGAGSVLVWPVPDIVRAQLSIGGLLVGLLDIYSWLIIARVIISWVGLSPANPVVRFLQAATDPILTPIQNVIPPLGGVIDISPIIAFIFVQMLRTVIIRVFFG